MKIKLMVYPAKEGGSWAEIPALEDCIREGNSLDKLIHNLQDALQEWLEVANDSKNEDRCKHLN